MTAKPMTEITKVIGEFSATLAKRDQRLAQAGFEAGVQWATQSGFEAGLRYAAENPAPPNAAEIAAAVASAVATVLAQPRTRTVLRDADGLIVSVVDEVQS